MTQAADTPAPPLAAVILDLFGVVVSFDNDIVYARLARHCTDPERAFQQLNGLMASPEVITGRVTLPEVHHRLVEAHGFGLDYPGFEAAWLEPYHAPMPGMAELVGQLSGRCRLVLLSNVDGYYWQVVRAGHPELACFDKLLVSCDLGLAKPDPAVFAYASRAAGADPAHCLFVDDTRANVDAAAALGFRTHWFRHADGLRAELHRAGLVDR
ncbi:HAD-IA family hydrolase [Catellatospora sichuanensis]|uniref:HAD-IA family hydrolase n=1 Tax=Catellatospora sichuanensis TaxID=1969805 RepID=UPI001182F1E4|nr:HAD-IA family hydrolase [Catellatospora sichuanensis]